ncbi:MAG: SDR family oxidoreductase [Clostridia bacterium]|nr:SDR family oxidoreductase [Clostridia bacterium]
MNKTAFVTGSATGTGYAIAEQFAREGYSVVVTSLDQNDADEAAKKLSAEYGVFAIGYVLDIRDEERIIEVFKDMDAHGLSTETVVLNAADLGFGTDPAKGQDFFTVSTEEVSRVFETNLLGNFKIVRQAALRMREHGKGSVVFIGSNTAYRAIPNRAAYCASKGGMISLAKALAVDLGPYGIRCNIVLPGTIKTERWKAMGDKQIVNGELTPIGDISDFEDIAQAAWYFGSDASKNVTGAELTVDGGMSCQLYPVKLNEWKRIAKEK